MKYEEGQKNPDPFNEVKMKFAKQLKKDCKESRLREGIGSIAKAGLKGGLVGAGLGGLVGAPIGAARGHDQAVDVVNRNADKRNEMADGPDIGQSRFNTAAGRLKERGLKNGFKTGALTGIVSGGIGGAAVGAYGRYKFEKLQAKNAAMKAAKMAKKSAPEVTESAKGRGSKVGYGRGRG